MTLPAAVRQRAAELDSSHSGVNRREAFELPAELVYLDGNSLGALPQGVAERVSRTVSTEWGRGLIRSWNDADWMRLSRRVAAKIAPLIGAEASDIHVGDTTSVALFKTITAAARMQPQRRVIVVEESTFPTDAYIASGVAELLGLELRWADPTNPVAAVDESVALLSLTHVDFRTGAAFDMATVTAAAQARGALVQWDLCHSAGALEVELAASGADFAVGCTYKYLNGGPGAPAFLWVHPEHHATARQPITGWMGHADPFALTLEYTPAAGIGAWASGTHAVIALSALDTALDVFADIDLAALRAASVSLTQFFMELLAQHVPEVEVVTPTDTTLRGSQVSFRHEESFGIVQALISRGVIGDWRAPNLARFGFAPLYVTHADVVAAIEALRLVLDNNEQRHPHHLQRGSVT